MQTAKSVEQLPCPLTPGETMLKSKQAAQLRVEIGKLTDDMKAAQKSAKAVIDEKEDELTRLSWEVHSGEEIRPIECYERPRYHDSMVDILRADTGKVVRSRPMHPSERQLAMETSGDLSPPERTKREPTAGEDESAH